MSAKSIKLYESYVASQGRPVPKPVDIRGTKPRASRPVSELVTAVEEIPAMRTAAIWELAENALLSARWHTARAALDELGLRLDSAYERLQHADRGCPMLPELTSLAHGDELPPCFRPVIGDRIAWVNNLASKARVWK